MRLISIWISWKPKLRRVWSRTRTVSWGSTWKAKGGEYDREQLNFIVRDLLMAGTDTTANSMLWGLIMLANNPDVQRHLRQEIDMVVPRTRLPSLKRPPTSSVYRSFHRGTAALEDDHSSYSSKSGSTRPGSQWILHSSRYTGSYRHRMKINGGWGSTLWSSVDTLGKSTKMGLGVGCGQF